MILIKLLLIIATTFGEPSYFFEYNTKYELILYECEFSYGGYYKCHEIGRAYMQNSVEPVFEVWLNSIEGLRTTTIKIEGLDYMTYDYEYPERRFMGSWYKIKDNWYRFKKTE